MSYFYSNCHFITFLKSSRLWFSFLSIWFLVSKFRLIAWSILTMQLFSFSLFNFLGLRLLHSLLCCWICFTIEIITILFYFQFTSIDFPLDITWFCMWDPLQIATSSRSSSHRKFQRKFLFLLQVFIECFNWKFLHGHYWLIEQALYISMLLFSFFIFKDYQNFLLIPNLLYCS